jgi:uncharacterized membrane protein
VRRLAFVLLALAAAAGAKSYRYPRIHTVVTLEPGGDARIVQDRTYRFDGSFSWAFVDLDKRGADGITLNGLYRVSEGGVQAIVPLEVSDSRSSLYIRWGYVAEDEEWTFRLDYTVRGAVRRFADVAEFYWKTIEDEHEPVASATAEVVLPGPSPGRFKVFVHTRARPGKLELGPAAGVARVELADVPRNAFVELRVLADPALFAAAPAAGGPAYRRILAEEQRNHVLSALRVFLLLPLAGLLVLLVPAAMLVASYRRSGREPRVEYDAVYEHEPPRRAPPLAVPAIMRQEADDNARSQEAFRGLFAQLVHLAVRGAVTVEESGRKGYRFRLEKMPADADEFDHAAATLVFGGAGRGGDTVTDKEFRDHAQRNATAVRASLAALYERGTGWWERALGGPLLDAASRRARIRYRLLAFLSVGAGVVAGASGLEAASPGPRGVGWVIAGAAGFVVYIVLLGLSSSVLRWTPRGHLEHRRWRRFERFMRDFSALEQAPPTLIAIWEQYYVYAVALGVAEQFLKNLGRLAAERRVDPVLPAWFVMRHPGTTMPGASLASFAEGMKGLAGFGSNFAAMASAFSPRSSSGGGFAGGGGGGGGGGRSGAG